MNDNCSNPIVIFTAVGVLNLYIDTLFICYVFYRFGRSVTLEEGEDGKEDLNVCQKIVHFFCYDIGSLIYWIFLIFHVVWTILLSAWIAGETTACKEQTGWYLGNAIVIMTWVFLFLMQFVGFFTLLYMAIQEGSDSP